MWPAGFACLYRHDPKPAAVGVILSRSGLKNMLADGDRILLQAYSKNVFFLLCICLSYFRVHKRPMTTKQPFSSSRQGHTELYNRSSLLSIGRQP
jgi:hypothetical protein